MRIKDLTAGLPMQVFSFLISIVLLTNIQFISSANAETLTAKFLDIPFTNSKTYSSPWYSVEIDGPQVQKMASCGDFVEKFQPQTIWQIGNKQITEYMFDETDVLTLGVTSGGIKCAFLHRSTNLFSDGGFKGGFLHAFAQNEEKAPVNLTMYVGATAIGTGSGFLFNPDYFPDISAEAPTLGGVNRGAVVNGSAILTVTPPVSTLKNVGVPTIRVCNNELPCNDNFWGQDNLGWGTLLPDGTIGILFNAIQASYTEGNTHLGNLGRVQVDWSFKNSTQNIKTQSSELIFEIGPSTSLVPWKFLSNFASLFADKIELSTGLKCGSVIAVGNKLNCSIEPMVLQVPLPGQSVSDRTVINTLPEYDVLYSIDGGEWKNLSKVTGKTDTKTTFSLAMPKGKYHQISLKLKNSLLYQVPDDGLISYGSPPVGPKVTLDFPNYVLWNTPFVMSATVSGGNATKCAFSLAGTNKILGIVPTSKNVAKITVSAVWAGSPGSTTTLKYVVYCNVGSKVIYGGGFVSGYR